MAVNNALANYGRKKGKPPVQLWKKHEKIDADQAKEQLRIIEDMHKKDDSWIRKIWAANRRK